MEIFGPWKIGPLSLSWEILSAALALTGLWLWLRRPKQHPEAAERRRLWNSLFNALIWGFWIWKLSPFLSFWGRWPAEWWSLIYLPGDVLGLVLGALAFGGRWAYDLFRRPEGGWKTDLLRAGPGLAGAVVLALLVGAVPGWVRGAQTGADPAEAAGLAGAEGGAFTLTLPDLNGLPQTWPAGEETHIVLNFWATWCPPCLAELPELNVWNQERGPATGFWAVNLAATEPNPELVGPFLEARQVSIPVVRDPGELSRRYDIQVIPTTLIVSRQGRVLWRHSGALTAEMLRRAVADLPGNL